MAAEKNGGTAVCPGSYDPVTFGHLDIIGGAANVFDQVVVGVVDQPVRKRKTLFTAEERVGFITAEVAEYSNVQVKPFDNLLVDFAREHGAKAIVKGLRAISDFEYEFEMNAAEPQAGPRHREHLHDERPPIQLSELEWSQGTGDVRGRCERPGTRPGGGPIAGRTEAVEN